MECEFYPTGNQTEENELQLIEYDGQNINNQNMNNGNGLMLKQQLRPHHDDRNA